MKKLFSDVEYKNFRRVGQLKRKLAWKAGLFGFTLGAIFPALFFHIIWIYL